MEEILHIIQSLPEDYTTVQFQNKTYGLTKSTFNNGKSFKVFAEELQGTDFISLNLYVTSNKTLLKPCEMSSEKVIAFLKQMKE